MSLKFVKRLILTQMKKENVILHQRLKKECTIWNRYNLFLTLIQIWAFVRGRGFRQNLENSRFFNLNPSRINQQLSCNDIFIDENIRKNAILSFILCREIIVVENILPQNNNFVFVIQMAKSALKTTYY